MSKIVFLVILALISYFAVVDGIRCIYAVNGEIKYEDHQCPDVNTLCSTLTVYGNKGNYVNSTTGCGQWINWIVNGKVHECTATGSMTLIDSNNGLKATFDCCDTDLCNAATTPFSFVGIFILASVVPFLFS